MKKEINRRDFLKYSAIGSTTLVAAGCDSDPVEELIPLLIPPDEYMPGESIHYTTVCHECSANCGLVIRTREGRAIKAEGNPLNPLNKGRICAQGQASMQGLYSPSRSQGPIVRRNNQTETVTWEDGKKIFSEELQKIKNQSQKRVLYIGPPQSGSFPDFIKEWITLMGTGRVFQFDLTPVNSLKIANKICFGKEEIPFYAIDKTTYLLNFGADFMESWLNPIQLTGQYTTMHQIQNGQKGKFVHISPHMSLTGTNADEWVSCPVGAETSIALKLAQILLPKANHLSSTERAQITQILTDRSVEQVSSKNGLSTEKLEEIAQAFRNGGKSLAIAGGNATTGKRNQQHLQVAVNILNYLAGNIEKSIIFGADYKIGGESIAGLNSIIHEMNSGLYEMVIIENVNPAFTLPQDSQFISALKSVPYVVSLSTENDETSRLADLHLPVSHNFESWGDAQPRNGIYALQQATMSKIPAFDTVGLGDLLIQIAQMQTPGAFGVKDYQNYLKKSWQTIYEQTSVTGSFKEFWKQVRQDGGVYRDFTPVKVKLQEQLYVNNFSPKSTSQDQLTLLAVNSAFHNANARGATRSWLQEIPHPVTQVVWDSWVEIHPETAVKLGIRHGDLVEVSSPAGKVELAAWIFYGIDPNTIAIPTGLGRDVMFPKYFTSRGKNKFFPIFERKEDRMAKPQKIGINVMDLFSWDENDVSEDLSFLMEDIKIKPTGKKADLVTMDGQYRDDIASEHFSDMAGFGDRSQKGRGFIQTLSIGQAKGNGNAPHIEHHQLRERHYTIERENNTSFYQPMKENVADHVKMAGDTTPVYHSPYKWEMIIDLDRCIGCSSCAVACYAENNVPLVGKDRSALGREMSWLRIERYFEHNHRTGQLETYYSPQMCQQCDNAGCEPVCPVYATYQTPEGLNAMVYNRCVGTRYCSNNCAFKQRRFNWRGYEFPAPLHMQLNPAVTVRSKGVMEKCTFCQQRIREMKDIAKDQGRIVKDGEIQTACQQACPTNAIVFGNINDKTGELYRTKTSTQRGYIQLEELNFQPAVTYLKKANHHNSKA